MIFNNSFHLESFRHIALIAVTLFTTSVIGVATAGDTLDTVRKRGHLQAGVHTGLVGFAMPDSEGRWHGFDVDICRAVAAAVFGDADKVKYVPLSAQQRFTALQSGEIDVLSRNTTHTLTRDSSLGLNFGPATYYDGQGFMVPVALGVKSARELDGATVCVLAGTTTEMNLADYFRTRDMDYKGVVIENKDEVAKAFFSERCDVLTADASALAGERIKSKKPEHFRILPEIISKEPLGPVVRHGDDQWLDIVSWSVWAMINAEELGISSVNVEDMQAITNPKVRRLLGESPGMGAALGLDEKWAYHIIKQVGNYGECFDRNLGRNSSLNINRGINRLWSDGGILYAPPIR